MPAQENGFDCGLYLLAVAEAACEWAGLDAERLHAEEARLRSWLTPQAVRELRGRLLQLLRGKMEKPVAAASSTT